MGGVGRALVGEHSETRAECYMGFKFKGGFYFEAPLGTELYKLSREQFEMYKKSEIKNSECYSLELYLPEPKVYGYVLLL